jgi:hypothetical protein
MFLLGMVIGFVVGIVVGIGCHGLASQPPRKGDASKCPHLNGDKDYTYSEKYMMDPVVGELRNHHRD